MSVHPWLSPGGSRPGGRAALAAVSWLTSPLSPDDYLGLVDPLWSARHPAGRVRAVRREAPGAATLVIRPGRGWNGHRAGQYLPLGVEIDGVRHWRTYSLTSPPGRVPGGELTVTVKARPDGRVSPHLVHRTKPGTVLRLGPAQGEFVLPRPLARDLLFVTAGSGITPVVGMLRSLARHGGDGVPDTLLLHSAPSPDECLFRAELAAMERRLPWLRVRVTYTRTQGRLTAHRIGALCPDWAGRDTWACGPAGLLDAAERQWAAAGARERLRVERFHLVPLRVPEAGAVGGRVRFGRSGVEADATAAAPLLEVGEAAGVPMPHGCRRGLCLGCLVPLLDGRVRDLRTGELHGGPGELIQTCVNGAAGPLVLDL
ncbi:ferredoxin reductase [Streptomyces sp. SID14478]|uniref:ferredoxin reductase n=1 Tax=Streptomyces sp. SID14478 TaxID=2706073 RepID=UPI0013E09E58|nr:ferredoxin reductase [Streptomyces sp. SID14478]NEB80372.1 ferredoxin reductase [Streptomyces sp. SID14478]